MLVDEYSEDWSALWWVRLRGKARDLDGGEGRERAVELLAENYPHAAHSLDGPVLAIEIDEWRGWSARPAD